MYICYNKLWKLMLDKKINKTELMEYTGISSRVMAKLSKNETVTTETLARICEALNCDVSDIMECVKDDEMPVWEHFRKNGRLEDVSNLYKTVTFSVGETKYRVFVTLKRATKHTHIHCAPDGTVTWEQLYLFGGYSMPQIEQTVLIRPMPDKDEVTIVLISGKPAMIHGLDDGICISSRNLNRDPKNVYVMSETAFKLFSPNKNTIQ